MAKDSSFLIPACDLAVRYRVTLLPEAELSETGLVHREGAASRVLEWSRVQRALAAEVGEPEGVRTIVFDLIVEIRGDTCAAVRFDADPSENAVEWARALDRALGPERSTPSIKSVAVDGVPGRWFPDVESFEAANLAILFGG